MHFLVCMYEFAFIMISSLLSIKWYGAPIEKAQNMSLKIELTAILCKIKVIFRYELSILIHYRSLLMCTYMYNINLCRIMQIMAMNKKKREK